MPPQDSYLSTPYHRSGYRENESSDSDNTLEGTNKGDYGEFADKIDFYNCNGTNKCTSSNMKILAASITYKDLNHTITLHLCI